MSSEKNENYLGLEVLNQGDRLERDTLKGGY